MPTAIAILVAAQLLGEVLSQLLHLPLPGAVMGMLLLALALIGRASLPGSPSNDTLPLVDVAKVLTNNMGLLFVPAGVGVIAQASVLRQAWLPIVLGLLVSTLLGLVVTAAVMNHLSRGADARASSGGLP